MKEYINIRYISIDETARHASKKYLSTLAVLQLDTILENAKKYDTVKSNPNKKNQNDFSDIILMSYELVGFGKVKLTVGIRRKDKAKIQYCITVIK